MATGVTGRLHDRKKGVKTPEQTDRGRLSALRRRPRTLTAVAPRAPDDKKCVLGKFMLRL
ncbi:MAG: hypothetical protein ACKOD9_08390 [Rubrivivax sp.]